MPERSLDKTLIVMIGLLLIFIGGVFFVRSLTVSANPELSSDQTIRIGTPTTDGFTTVFILAENAATTSTTYQEHLRETIGILAVGVIGVIYAGALLVYRAIFNLRFTRTPITIAALSTIALFGGTAVEQSLLKSRLEDVRNCTQLQSMYDSRQYKTVEGVVHVNYQSRGSGHGESGDLIQVGTAPLEITNYEPTCGYDKIIALGGALTEGTYARVYYTNYYIDFYNNYRPILRIDVKNR